MTLPLLGNRTWSLALTAVAATSLGCLRDNPAYEFADTLAGTDEAEEDPGDGDGDPSGEGDGDADPTTGDGDADPTTGDGDADPTTGDGDGDGDPTTGDGDADPTTGDGDGDGESESTTGDGDGDLDPDLCITPLPLDEYAPFVTASIGDILAETAPEFDLAPTNCLLLMVCPASADYCDPEHSYLGKVYSSGDSYAGAGLMEPQSLQLRFHLGGAPCDGVEFDLGVNNYVKVQVWNGQNFDQLPVKLPCIDEFDVPLYIAGNGSTFWDPELSMAAALWE